MMKKLIHLLSAAVIIIMFSACSENLTSDNNAPGKLVVKVTDAPFAIDLVESAMVTITKVEIRRAGDGLCDGVCDSTGEGNPFTVISEDTMTFDLIQLRNGIAADLAELDIPQGKYDLIRLYVDEASLTIKDGETYTVKVPSGKQTGIKIFLRPALEIEGGLTSELLIDFDLSRSFLMRGNLRNPNGIKGFIFKPVIRAVNMSTAGRIEGMVSDTSKVKVVSAQVWVKQDTLIATAITDTLGHYAFIGIPSGTYSLFATKENYDTVSFAGVKVVAGNRTIQNFVLTD